MSIDILSVVIQICETIQIKANAFLILNLNLITS